MTIATAVTDEHLNQILELQFHNLPEQLTSEEIKSDGFLTCRHDFDLMKRMNYPHPHVIALDRDSVVGYALVLRPTFRGEVEILDHMFDMIDRLKWKGKPMNAYSFFVMGQICIAKDYRGQNIFYDLYHKMKELYSDKYQLCITEVSGNNPRSQRAHDKQGWEIAHSYIAPDGHPWNLLVWDWS